MSDLVGLVASPYGVQLVRGIVPLLEQRFLLRSEVFWHDEIQTRADGVVKRPDAGCGRCGPLERTIFRGDVLKRKPPLLFGLPKVLVDLFEYVGHVARVVMVPRRIVKSRSHFFVSKREISLATVVRIGSVVGGDSGLLPIGRCHRHGVRFEILPVGGGCFEPVAKAWIVGRLHHLRHSIGRLERVSC